MTNPNPIRLPKLHLQGVRPSDTAVQRAMDNNPGLGQLQAYRMVQAQQALKVAATPRYFGAVEARRHMGA